MRQAFTASAIVVVVALAGCGGGDGGGGGGPAATPASVTVSQPASTPLPSLGDSRVVSAVVRDANGTTLPTATVTWSAAPSTVLALSATSGASVSVTAVTNGSATLTASSGLASGQVTVEVAQRFASLVATPSPLTVSPSGTRQLVPAARDARDNTIAAATGFTYASNDIAIATVSTAGLVSGVTTGTTTVTVALTRDGVTGSTLVPVTVAAAALSASVAATATNVFNPVSVEIGAGGTVTWSFATLHNVTFVSPNSPENIPERSSGTASATFPTVGTFNYTCTIHAGMNGTVVVR